jgi:hypothetical protein
VSVSKKETQKQDKNRNARRMSLTQGEIRRNGQLNVGKYELKILPIKSAAFARMMMNHTCQSLFEMNERVASSHKPGLVHCVTR